MAILIAANLSSRLSRYTRQSSRCRHYRLRRHRPARAVHRSHEDAARRTVGDPRRFARRVFSDPEESQSIRPHAEFVQRPGKHSVRRRDDQAAGRRTSCVLTFAANSRLKSILVSLFPAAKAQSRPVLTISYNVTARQDFRLDAGRRRYVGCRVGRALLAVIGAPLT